MTRLPTAGILALAWFILLALPLQAGPLDGLVPVEGDPDDGRVALDAQRYTALHFLAASERDGWAAHVERTLAEAPAFAGVRHLFVLPAGVSAPAGLDATARRTLVRDPGGVVSERHRAGSSPSVVVLDPGGETLHRAEGAGGSFVAFRSLSAQVELRWRDPHLSMRSLERGLALGGYDPVAMVNEQRAVRGTRTYSSSWRGIAFHFASAENRRTFAEDPARFLPAYGGWCATSMAEGDRVRAEPGNFLVHQGRLYLFGDGIFGNARDAWEQDAEALREQADRHWERMAPPDARGR